MAKKKESFVLCQSELAVLHMEGGHEAKLSLADASRVAEHNWHISRKANGSGVYVVATIDGRLVNLNNFLTGAKLGAHTPHRNSDELDFRQENLDTLESSITVEAGIASMKVTSNGRDYAVLFDEADVKKVISLGQRWSILNTGYVYGGGQYFHRFLLDAAEGMEVDHNNRNRLDNRRSNLAEKTPQGNAVNRPSAFATSGRYAKEKNPYRGKGERRSRNTIPPVRIDGDKAYLQLTQGQVAIIDATDAATLGKVLWHAIWNENTHSFYAKSGTHNGPYLHQAIMGTWGLGRSIDIDHINGDTLDCRRSNLRIVTKSQNAQNLRGANRNSKTGVRNVYRHDSTQMLEVKVMVRGKGHYGGFFPDTEEGLRKATEAARLLREQLHTHSDGR